MSEGARVNARHASALLSALVDGGVQHAVVSPGSRNTPIVLALAANASVSTEVVLDERSAAFYALGLARASGTPVLLSCTSGSAGAHWLPAVIEASRSGVPLVLVTADRPAELQGMGAPQTVDQRGLFGPHVRTSVELGAPHREVHPAWLVSVAARVLDAAAGPNPGPVHINAPFRKPLWFDGVDSSPAPLTPARVVRGPPRLEASQLDRITDRLLGAPRGAIVVGPRELALSRLPWSSGSSEAIDPFGAAVAELAERLGWPLIAEPASRARFGQGRMAIAHADAILRDSRFAERMAPDAILRFGQDPTNKAIYSWCSRHGKGRTDVVDPTGAWQDPHHVADSVLAVDPTWLCAELCSRLPERTASIEWFERWRQADRTAGGALSHHCAQGLWEGAIVRCVAEAVPEGGLLHLASSMAIRSADTFCGPLDRPISVAASRGANGIDGTIATALGEATGWRHGPTVAVMGDLAFLHDIGSLQAARQLDASLTVVVIDNGGGNIFGMLPIQRHPTAFERFFLTPQQADIPALAVASGASVEVCRSIEATRAALATQLGSPGVSVLYVPVDRADDGRRRAAALDAVHRALEGEFPEVTAETR